MKPKGILCTKKVLFSVFDTMPILIMSLLINTLPKSGDSSTSSAAIQLESVYLLL
jgi:hypothetical protein